MTPQKIHYWRSDEPSFFSPCGAVGCYSHRITTNRAAVTCNRCLAALAKRDGRLQLAPGEEPSR